MRSSEDCVDCLYDPVDVISRYPAVSDKTHQTEIDAAGQHPVRFQMVAKLKGGHAGFRDIEIDHVGIHAPLSQGDARPANCRLRESSGIGVIFCKTFDEVIERIDATGRKQAGLAHGAAHQEPRTRGSLDDFMCSTEH